MLIGIAAAATATGLGIAYWSVGAVVRQVSTPYGEITHVLAKIDTIKRDMESQMQTIDGVLKRSALPVGGEVKPDPELVRIMQERIEEVRSVLSELALDDAFRRYSGVSASASISARVYDLADLLEQCTASVAAGRMDLLALQFAAAREPFETLHQMIEDLEGRMLADMELSLAYSDEARAQVNSLLIVCLVLALLALILVYLLQVRWFSKPLTALREAASELSQGNFAHRIPVMGRDELGLVSQEINEMAGTITSIQGQLVERERMAAIGEMMRRIVHNLRNPLAGIRSLAELTRSELPQDSDEYESQQRIIRTVDRFEEWLNGMLQSTRPLDLNLEPTDVCEYVRSTVELQRATGRGRKIELECRLDDGPLEARIDPVHFQHVVVALVANAIEACEEGGRVRISVLAGPSGTDRGWVLRVEDDGPGIADELQARIFEPYFTTKKHGSGIGLAVVKNIVVAHDGSIAVGASEMGGARFDVTLGKA